MSGQTDLAKMLANLSVTVRQGTFTVVSVSRPLELGDGVEALLVEDEGLTVIATVEAAKRHGWAVGFEAAWLTLDVHSSLEAVGLTAAVATALARSGISCNVLAGFYHDHILVQADRVAEAIECLTALRG